MKNAKVFSIMLLALIAGLSQPTAARAQVIFPGSTPQGDYLRGLGIELMGEGLYNRNTAEAESINANTFMRLDRYWASVFNSIKEEYLDRRSAIRANRLLNREKTRQRLAENPEPADVLRGDSLNKLMDDLLDKKLTESAFRYAEVPIPAGLVRKIPFKLAEEGVTISMARILPDGKKWNIAFQDDRCLGDRRIYEQAVDRALGQAIEGHIQDGTIEMLEQAINGLERRLNDGTLPRTDKRYVEGKKQLDELRKIPQQLKITKVENVIGEIDKYGGMNVNDLRHFMEKYKLRFDVASTTEELALYPELYATLVQQRDALNGDGKAAKP